MRVLISGVFGVGACALLAQSPALAETAEAPTAPHTDVVADFTGSNPNGVWSYWAGTTGLSMSRDNIWGYIPATNQSTPENGIEYWAGLWFPSATNYNFILRDIAGKPFLSPANHTVVYLPSDLNLDPTVAEQAAIVCWTALTKGRHTFKGLFEALDTGAHGVGTAVFDDVKDITATVFPTTHGTLKGAGANGTKLAPGVRETFLFNLTTVPGEHVCFGVYPNDGNGNNESTGLRLTVTPPR